MKPLRLPPNQVRRFYRGGACIARLRPGFSILIVLHGKGRLVTEAGELELRRGDGVLVPWAAGEGEIKGELELLRCLSPEVT